MGLPKRIKLGGAYYEGYFVTVGATPGAYTQIISQPSGMAVNSVSVTPDAYGAGDTWGLAHLNDSAGTGQTLALLAKSINNMGKNAAVMLDFPAAELVNPGESLKFTYTNSASTALSVYLIVEAVGIKKTS